MGRKTPKTKSPPAPMPVADASHKKPSQSPAFSLGEWVTGYSSSALPLIALCGFVFFLATMPIWMGTVSPKWDADMAYVGVYTLLSDFTRSSQLLLWSPWTSAGAPILTSPGVGSFSPLVLLLSFVIGPGEEGFRIYWLTIWLLGLVGMIFLVRHFKTPNWVCIVIALGYAFSGGITGHAEHTDFVYAMGLLPWCIWTFDRVLMTPSVVHGATAGLVLGLLASGSYPGVTFGTLTLYTVWLICRLVTWPRTRLQACNYPGRCIAALSVAGLVSAMLTLPPYIAFSHEAPGYSVRSDVLDKSAVLNSNALTTASLATFLNPYFTNLALLKGSVFAPTDVSSVGLYLGFVPLVLLFLALCFRGEGAFPRSLAAGAALFFLLACSIEFPLRSWLYDWFPPSRYFRHSSLLRIFSVFLLFAVIASRGQDWNSALRSVKSTHRDLFRGLLCALVAVSAVCHAVLLWALEPPAALELASPWLAMFFGMSGLILASVLTVLAMRRDAHRLALLLLLAVAASDAVFTGYLAGPTLFWRAPRAREKWDALSTMHRPDLTIGSDRVRGSYRNDNLLTKTPELANYNALKNPFFDAILTEPKLLDLVLRESRWWFASQAVFSASTTSNHDRYLHHIRQSGSVPLFVTRETEGRAEEKELVIPAESHLARIPARVAAYSPTHLELSVRASQAGWLLVTDRWSRAWTAEVDGARVNMEQGNFLFRAVEIPAGDHRVAFDYEIGWLIPYLIASCIALVLGTASATWEILAHLRLRREDR